MDQAIAAISFTFPGVPGVRCAFGMRATSPARDASGGDEPADPFCGGNISYRVGDDPERVTRTGAPFQKALGFSSWHSLTQVHGTDMVFDPDQDTLSETSVPRADGQATSRPGAALAIKTADCQPILLAHASGRHVAALHAGWRGNVMDFPGTGWRPSAPGTDCPRQTAWPCAGRAWGRGPRSSSISRRSSAPGFAPISIRRPGPWTCGD
jgi:hypothetical protein